MKKLGLFVSRSALAASIAIALSANAADAVETPVTAPRTAESGKATPGADVGTKVLPEHGSKEELKSSATTPAFLLDTNETARSSPELGLCDGS